VIEYVFIRIDWRSLDQGHRTMGFIPARHETRLDWSRALRTSCL